MKCKFILFMCLLLTFSTESESLKILRKIKDFLHPTTTVQPDHHHEEKNNDGWKGDEDSNEDSKSDSHSSESDSGGGYNKEVRTTVRPSSSYGYGSGDGSQNHGESGGTPYESATKQSIPLRPDHQFDVEDNAESQWGGPGGPTTPSKSGPGGYSSGYNNRQPSDTSRPSYTGYDAGRERTTKRPSYDVLTTTVKLVPERQDGGFGQSNGSTSGFSGSQSTYGDGTRGRPQMNENANSAVSQQSNNASSTEGQNYGRQPTAGGFQPSSGGFQLTGSQTPYNNVHPTSGPNYDRQPTAGGFQPTGSQTAYNNGQATSAGTQLSSQSSIGPQSNYDRDQSSYGSAQSTPQSVPEGTGHDSREGSLVYPDHPSLNPTTEPERPFERHRYGPKHDCDEHSGCENTTATEGTTFGSDRDSTTDYSSYDSNHTLPNSTTVAIRDGKSKVPVAVDDGRTVINVPGKECPEGQRVNQNGSCKTPVRK